jgi:hypothetical protein
LSASPAPRVSPKNACSGKGKRYASLRPIGGGNSTLRRPGRRAASSWTRGVDHDWAGKPGQGPVDGGGAEPVTG